MVRPNWKNSILNLSATLNELLGGKTEIPKIKKLKKFLRKNYDNIVFICLDGFGIYPINQNLDKNSFLKKHIIKKITSVFPSTTTNATTTLLSTTYPSQHGLFGWSLFFEEYAKCVDIYLKQDTYTKDIFNSKVIDNYMKFDYFFDINNSNFKVKTIFPSYIIRERNNIVYEDAKDMFNKIKECCLNKKKNFIYAYCGEPDATMHNFGVNSPQTKKIISFLNSEIEKLSKTLNNTLLIISADHGHIDIKDYIKLYQDKELSASLNAPFYLEARAVAFKVGNKEKFLKAIKKYKKDAKLVAVKKLVRRNYFGPNNWKLKMLGDYILIMKNNNKQFLFSETHTKFKGHHTSLTKKEMVLPLIVCNK